MLIVLCGPSHSGKSSFVRRYCKGFTVISSEAMRRELTGGSAWSAEEGKVWETFELRKREALRKGSNVVLDACHMSERARWHALQGPNRRHRKVCIVFDLPLETLRRRCRRDGRLSVREVERMWRAFQKSKPSRRELRRLGFGEVYFVRGQEDDTLTAARVTGPLGSGSRVQVRVKRRTLRSRAWCGGRSVPASLVDGGRGWGAHVEVSEVDNPRSLVKNALATTGLLEKGLGLIAGQSVNGHEVLEEIGARTGIMDEGDVLDGMAPVAQGLEGAEPLVAGLGIELPDLVTVQPRLSAAGLASVSSAAVHGSPERVPVVARQELCQSGQARAPGDGVDGEPKMRHDDVCGGAAL